MTDILPDHAHATATRRAAVRARIWLVLALLCLIVATVAAAALVVIT